MSGPRVTTCQTELFARSAPEPPPAPAPLPSRQEWGNALESVATELFHRLKDEPDADLRARLLADIATVRHGAGAVFGLLPEATP